MTDVVPSLGVGVIYAPGLEELLEAGHDMIDVVEIEPETLWFQSRAPDSVYAIDPDAIEHLAKYPQRKLVHGVGFPIGGTLAPDKEHVEPFVSTIEALHSPWSSEHLSFNQAKGPKGPVPSGFLLPPIQTPDAVEVAARNIVELRRWLPVPFAFETGVNYLQPQPGEMTDGAFFASIADLADCGILLDLHNLWTNQENGRQSIADLLEELPLERVWEIHLGGGEPLDGYWLDAHSGLTPPQVIELARDLIPRLPALKALVFELAPEYLMAKGIPIEELLGELHEMRGLWEIRSDERRIEKREEKAVRPRQANSMPTPEEWETSLVEAINLGDPPDSGELTATIATDPGLAIYRKLVTSVRAGMAVASLKLTSRLIRLSLGESQFEALLAEFWGACPPSLFSSEEARNLASYLRSKHLPIPNLYEVLAFELALQAALIHRERQVVRFSCDPQPLLAALGKGQLPSPSNDTANGTPYQVVLNPPVHKKGV